MPGRIVEDVKRNFKPMMLANWKLWPFVHLLTYTVIPTRFKLLWVDVVEVVWITYLSIVANKQTQNLVDEVVVAAPDTVAAKEESEGGGGGRDGGCSSGGGDLRGLAERVDALRAAAAEGAAERAEARERHADGLSLREPGMGSAGLDRYQGN